MFESNLSFTNTKKPKYTTKLNLIALMDIFTILVFFLLINSGDSKQLEHAKFVKLPDSSAGTAPHGDLTIIIGESDIWVEKEVVASVEEILKEPEKNLNPLVEALQQYVEDRGELTSYEEEMGLAVTIVGDQSVSYGLLQRIMTTCQDQNFRNISLAVNRVVAPVVDFSGEVVNAPALGNTGTGG